MLHLQIPHRNITSMNTRCEQWTLTHMYMDKKMLTDAHTFVTDFPSLLYCGWVKVWYLWKQLEGLKFAHGDSNVYIYIYTCTYI